jgi:hypothetical protein
MVQDTLIMANLLDLNNRGHVLVFPVFTVIYALIDPSLETRPMKKTLWLDAPEEHDYPAAADYLDLLFPGNIVEGIVNRLRKAPTVTKKAKDILRASGLPLLPKDNIHVQHDLDKVKDGKKLAPILLVRGKKLIIADGYHRICTIHYLSEDLEVPCRITNKQ